MWCPCDHRTTRTLFGPVLFVPFQFRPVCTLSVTNHSHPMDHDTFVPLGSRHVCTSWITTRSYLLDHDMIVDLGSRYIASLGSRCTLWSLVPFGPRTLWSSYPLILATLRISYLLVTCILWYLTTFGNSWPLATRNLWRLVPFWSNLSAMVSKQRNQPWPQGL